MTEVFEERQSLHDSLLKIKPWDFLEEKHLAEAIQWVQSAAEIYRLQKPDIPSKHLAVYYILVDTTKESVLLVNHRMAKGWIPGGGHVDCFELPQKTVIRELWEELKLEASLKWPDPLFLTVTEVGADGFGKHTDVTLWYVLEGSETMSLEYDQEEFTHAQWFPFDRLPESLVEPHFFRFIEKLRTYLR